MNFSFCQQKKKYEEMFLLHEQFVFVAGDSYNALYYSVTINPGIPGNPRIVLFFPGKHGFF